MYTNKTIKEKGLLQRAFTLVEMLVVVAIFSIITTIMLTQNANFADRLLITNLAYDVAFTVRDAQNFAINVQGIDYGSGQDFNVTYGVYFFIQNPGQYVFFADMNEDRKFTPGIDEEVSRFSFGRGNKITRLCGYTTTGGGSCLDAGKMSVTFRRPNPDAFMRDAQGREFKIARVQLESPKGDKRWVVINSTGQIAITNQDAL